MSNFSNKTRVNKFDKRRKNTKMMSVLIVAGTILLVVLIAFWIFGGKDKDEVQTNDNNVNTEQNDDNQTENNNEEDKEIETNTNTETETNKETENNNNNSTDNNDVVENNDDESNNDNDSEENSDESDDEDEKVFEKESVDGSDSNVKEAYTANWEPVGTEQSGPHTTVYDKDSSDWNEMEEAARMATGLTDMFTWWIGNNGGQKAIATVSDPGETQVYRVYLSWIDNEGWQPTKVEELIENDKN